MNVLFWNTNLRDFQNKKSDNIKKCLIEMIIENKVDLLSLAEYSDNMQELCDLINVRTRLRYIPIPNHGGCKKIKGILNDRYRVESLIEQSRYQIVKINTISYVLLIAMIHNISKLNADEKLQKEILSSFRSDIEVEEQVHNCKNTLAIGDYNANPFEESCISAAFMHSMPFYEEVIEKHTRKIQGKTYQKFYNPTWKFFGNKEVPYTTYHYDNSGQMENYCWNVFDQVLIRPTLMRAFNEDKLKIIAETQNHNLMNNGKPDKTDYSDHLPLFCVLKEDVIR